MQLYDFAPFDGRANANMSSEALIFNKQNIDQMVEGFRTLSVEGRDNFSNKVNNVKINHRNKGVNLDYDSNDIVVTFELTSPNQYESEQRLANLKSLLVGFEKEFSFLDSQYYWEGTVTGFNITNPANYLNLIGTITITTQTPFRYTRDREVSGKIINGVNTVKISDSQMTSVAKPRLVRMTNGNTTNKIKLVSGSQELEFSQAVPANAVVIIDFDKLTVTVNGDTNPQSGGWITLHSDFGTFELKKGVNVTASGVAELTLKYRVEVL